MKEKGQSVYDLIEPEIVERWVRDSDDLIRRTPGICSGLELRPTRTGFFADRFYSQRRLLFREPR